MLFNHFRHDDLVVTLLGGSAGEDFGGIGFARLVAFAPDIEDAVRVCHRLNAFDVHRIEFVEVAENVVKLRAQFRLLLVAHVEAGKVGDVVDINVWIAHSESDRAERVVGVRVAESA